MIKNYFKSVKSLRFGVLVFTGIVSLLISWWVL